MPFILGHIQPQIAKSCNLSQQTSKQAVQIEQGDKQGTPPSSWGGESL